MPQTQPAMVSTGPGNLLTRMVLQVHDELIFEVPEDELYMKQRILARMQDVVALRVPLTVNIKQGRNWQNLTQG